MIAGTGILGDIFFKRADLVVAPIGIFFDRAKFVDFLPELEKYSAGLYIPSQEKAPKSFNFKTFFQPLR